MRDTIFDNACDFGGYNVLSVINGHVIVYHAVLIFNVVQVFQNASIVRFISNEHFAFRAVVVAAHHPSTRVDHLVSDNLIIIVVISVAKTVPNVRWILDTVWILGI